jgi:hypothetical protein
LMNSSLASTRVRSISSRRSRLPGAAGLKVRCSAPSLRQSPCAHRPKGQDVRQPLILAGCINKNSSRSSIPRSRRRQRPVRRFGPTVPRRARPRSASLVSACRRRP